MKLAIEIISWLVVGGALAVIGVGYLAIRLVLLIDNLARRIMR